MAVFSEKDLTAAEISDLIIKGLSHLNDDEKTDSEVFNMKAIEKLVGKTDENGHWIFGKGEEQIEVINIITVVGIKKL